MAWIDAKRRSAVCLYTCAALFMKSCLLSDGVLVQFRFGLVGEQTWSWKRWSSVEWSTYL
jgi:hypothetical protein